MNTYIYLISFEGTNDIYIGRTTQSLQQRISAHKYEDQTVNRYYKEKFRKEYNLNDWSKMYIDIIDNIKLTLEDIDNYYYNKENILIKEKYRKYTQYYTSKHDIFRHITSIIEGFHIISYKNDSKYNIINKLIPFKTDIYSKYDYLLRIRNDKNIMI
jgi:hypothetical protein